MEYIDIVIAYYKAVPLNLLKGIYTGWIEFLTFTLFMMVIIVASGRMIGAKKVVNPDGKMTAVEKSFLKMIFGEYLLRALWQDTLIALAIINLNALWYWNPYNAVMIALFFMSMHFPNRRLMFATGMLGMFFYIHFSLNYNLLFMVVNHAFCASLLMFYSPPAESTSWGIWSAYVRAQRNLTKKFKA
jgi:hypothetical protein